jgi:hypothetical protein
VTLAVITCDTRIGQLVIEFANRGEQLGGMFVLRAAIMYRRWRVSDAMQVMVVDKAIKFASALPQLSFLLAQSKRSA